MLQALLVSGEQVVYWVLSIVGAFVVRLVVQRIKKEKLKLIIGRALHEIGDAVLEITQTYVEALKKANPDGLTADEKKEAKARAIAKAKENLGTVGLARLARVLAADGAGLDAWLATKVEAAVNVTNAAQPRVTE